MCGDWLRLYMNSIDFILAISITKYRFLAASIVVCGFRFARLCKDTELYSDRSI